MTWHLIFVVVLATGVEARQVDDYPGMDKCFAAREQAVEMIEGPQTPVDSEPRLGWNMICIPARVVD